jgi:hypothetical protein
MGLIASLPSSDAVDRHAFQRAGLASLPSVPTHRNSTAWAISAATGMRPL